MGFERFSPVERLIEIDGKPLRIWRPPDMESLIDLVAFDADERIPYWADVWESAIVLGEELATLPGGGHSLLELGCGLGLLGASELVHWGVKRVKAFDVPKLNGRLARCAPPSPPVPTHALISLAPFALTA